LTLVSLRFRPHHRFVDVCLSYHTSDEELTLTTDVLRLNSCESLIWYYENTFKESSLDASPHNGWPNRSTVIHLSRPGLFADETW
jgi:hypothetical protein